MPPAQTAFIPYHFTARDGSLFIFAKKIAPQIPPQQIKDVNKIYKRDLNVRVRNARYTNEYNCHGLTFAAKLGWFDDVRRMLGCHSYIKVGSVINYDVDHFNPNTDVTRGDIVVYYDGNQANVTHTGIVWSKRTSKGKLYVTVLSKWGGYSEYFHRHDKVPIGYGKSVEVWTDRKI